MRCPHITHHQRSLAQPLGPYRSWRRPSCVKGLLLPSTPPKRSRSGPHRSQSPPLTLVFVSQTTLVSCLSLSHVTIHNLNVQIQMPFAYFSFRCHLLDLQGDRHGRGSGIIRLDERLLRCHGCCHWVAGFTPGPDPRPQRL